MEKAVRIQGLTRTRDEADVKLLLYSRETYLGYSDSACLFYRTCSIEARIRLVSVVGATSSRERDQHRPSLATQRA